MSRSWFCLDVLECATFLSIKVFSNDPRACFGRLTRQQITDTKVVYRRYASLFFIAGCASTDNELVTLEIVHRYVEQMDKYYGNVCELDIIFNFQKAYFILDELLLAGEMQESSKKNVLRCISQQDSLEDMEVSFSTERSCAVSNLPRTPKFKQLACDQLKTTDTYISVRLRMTASPRSCERDGVVLLCTYTHYLHLPLRRPYL